MTASQGERAAITSIYYLLEARQISRWHVVAADEIWHHYAGAPLELFAYAPQLHRLRRRTLAPAGASGGPVAVIEAGMWQAARSAGEYSLLGCTVAPGFEFADFQFVKSLPQHASHFESVLKGLEDLL